MALPDKKEVTMLSISSINYRLGKKQILYDVSANFLPGTFNMIMGQNGSGKSSFLKIFSGEINSYSGTVLYNNRPIQSYKKSELAKFRAVMSQQPELSFPLTVEEVVMMGRYPHFDFQPTQNDKKICNEVMSRMQLNNFKERNYLTLSGGEKQRVQYARVLSQIWESKNHFRYLFLDEPLNNLDIAYQQEFLEIATELKTNETILVAVMHDINLAAQFGDQLFFMKDGKMAASGKPSTILSETLIEQIFGVKTTLLKNPVSELPLVVFNKNH